MNEGDHKTIIDSARVINKALILTCPISLFQLCKICTCISKNSKNLSASFRYRYHSANLRLSVSVMSVEALDLKETFVIG